MTPFNILQNWKAKPYQKTNYENIQAFYGDQKYIKMKPKTQISLTPGVLKIILKQPKEWKHHNIKIDKELTLFNKTKNIMYFTLNESLFSDEEKELSLIIKNEAPKDNEEWLN